MNENIKTKLISVGIPSVVVMIFCVIIPIFIPDLAIYFGFGPKMSVFIYSLFCLGVCFMALYFTNDFHDNREMIDAVAVFLIVAMLVTNCVGIGTYDARYSKISTKISSVEIDHKTILLDPPMEVNYIVKDSDLEATAKKNAYRAKNVEDKDENSE